MATTLQVAAVLEKSTAEPITMRRFTAAGKALALTLGMRIFYSIFAAALSPSLRLDPNLIHSNSLTGKLMSRDLHPLLYALLGVWERFDTLWYIQISRHGYDNPTATVFFPLYPFLIRVVSVFTRSELAAALLISTGATFVLFWGALRLFELGGYSSTSFGAILLWALWPTSFTFFAGYPDSLVCALTVWSIVLARSDRWLSAGGAGFFAGLTKAMGCLAALPLLWIAWKQRRKEGLLAAGLSFAGVGCYQGWLILRRFPSATEVYRTYWKITTVAPWTTLIDGVRAASHNALVLLNLVVFAVVGTAALCFDAHNARPGALRPVRVEYTLYSVAAICLFLTRHTDPPLLSTARYSLTLFAAYPVLGKKLGRGLPLAVVLLIIAAINVALFRIFLEWGFVV
jgi:hypothetical protein